MAPGSAMFLPFQTPLDALPVHFADVQESDDELARISHNK
jgi:hypothetical protein